MLVLALLLSEKIGFFGQEFAYGINGRTLDVDCLVRVMRRMLLIWYSWFWMDFRAGRGCCLLVDGCHSKDFFHKLCIGSYYGLVITDDIDVGVTTMSMHQGG